MSRRTVPFMTSAFVGIWFLSGCSTQSIPKSDSAEAKRLVETTLKQWSEGKDWKDLAELSPPIYMSDDSWRNGWQLRDFTIEEATEMVGSNVRVSVKLRCMNKNGTPKDLAIRYFVTTTPAQTIAREES